MSSAVGLAWRETEAQLAAAGVANAAVEARWLHDEAAASPEPDRALAALVARRTGGEPLQYVLGHWPFRGVDLLVDRRVLIPRPETEVVAGHAIAELDRCAGGEGTVVDLGTGTGAVALAIAAERPGVQVWAVDRSPGALAVARANRDAIAGLGARVRLVEGSWFEPLPAQLAAEVAVVVSNPPYIGAHEVLPAEVADWEPPEALVAGPSGLEAVAAIAEAAPRWLAPGGALVVEIGATQGAAAQALARDAGFSHVVVHPDLAGRDRVLVARR